MLKIVPRRLGRARVCTNRYSFKTSSGQLRQWQIRDDFRLADPMKFAPIHRRALEKAARKLGGEDVLAEFLGVGADVVQAWMNGTRILPSRMFTAVVDLIAAD